MAIRQDLHPDSDKSKKIIKMLRDRFDFSYRDLSQRFADWDIAEEHYRAYRPIDQEDIESLAKNNVQKIIVPIQFATIQVMLTFWMEVFTALKPVLRTRGADPASVRPARVMELLLDYDYRGNRGYFMLYQWLFNTARYGYGVASNSWGSRQVLKRILKPSQASRIVLDGVDLQMPGELKWMNEYFTTFEGNKWEIVDNRTWFRDPRVPLSRFQEGEFCGKRTPIHYNDLCKLEDSGIFFNVDLIKENRFGMRSGSEPDMGMDSASRDKYTPVQALQMDIADSKKRGMNVNEEMIVELIPRDWELSDEGRPQQWIFNIIDGQVIVRCEENPFYGFNYDVMECYPDVFAATSQGVMEVTEPLANHINFLFNSHMANVRKAINDMFLFDPSRVDVRDILQPTAGKLIRLLPLAYGTDPATAFKQLAVTDVTQTHITDSKLLLDFWNRITGLSDSMYGIVASSRKTGREMEALNKSAASRMKMMADLMSAEGLAPFTERNAITRQENMSVDQFIEITGKTAGDLGVPPEAIIENWLQVSRDHITGVFEYPAQEGVLPGDRQMAAQMFQKLFETVSRSPLLMQALDPIEILKEAVRQGGLHNIDDFMRKGIQPNAQIVGSQQFGNMMASGKLQPFGGGGSPESAVPRGRDRNRSTGAPRGRPNQGVRESREGLNIEGYMNGAGTPDR